MKLSEFYLYQQNLKNFVDKQNFYLTRILPLNFVDEQNFYLTRILPLNFVDKQNFTLSTKFKKFLPINKYWHMLYKYICK